MKKSQAKSAPVQQDIPKTLDDSMFYGFNLDEQQKIYRDAMWNEEKRIVFCNARSGTGKTTLAVGVGLMLVEYGLYDGIVYIAAPHGYEKTGFLPGDITQKSEVFFEPLYQAIISCNRIPGALVRTDSMTNQKNGKDIIKPITHTFLRGSNLENKFVIIDESQNYTEYDLRKTLTRLCDSSKAVVIGHTGQIDLPNVRCSGFFDCICHFESKNDSRVAICSLDKNYRSWVSLTADEPWGVDDI